MKRWVLTLGITLGAAGSAAAPEACLRPVPPEEVKPPADDREFRDFLNGSIKPTFGDAGVPELPRPGSTSATKEVNEVMARWMLWFGDDAGYALTVVDRRSLEASSRWAESGRSGER